MNDIPFGWIFIITFVIVSISSVYNYHNQTHEEHMACAEERFTQMMFSEMTGPKLSMYKPVYQACTFYQWSNAAAILEE